MWKAFTYFIVAIPFMLGCVVVDAWQHHKGKGRVDKLKKQKH